MLVWFMTALIEETAAYITSLKGEIPQAELKETLALILTVPIRTCISYCTVSLNPEACPSTTLDQLNVS
jgi:hypothetical protein